jgi:hypothetical protein
VNYVPVSTRNFTFVQLQASLFTPENDAPNIKVGSSVQKVLEARFSGDPVVLPFPDEAPREFPRLILPSPDKAWRCEIAPSRLNLFWQPAVDGAQVDLSVFLSEASSLFREYRQLLGTRVDRLALVVTRFAEVDSPTAFLVGHFLQEHWGVERSRPLENVELNTHTTFQLTDLLVVNAWTRSSSASAEVEGERRGGVVVEQDVNTVMEDGVVVDYGIEAIESFFASVGGAIDEILRHYYPEGGAHE